MLCFFFFFMMNCVFLFFFRVWPSSTIVSSAPMATWNHPTVWWTVALFWRSLTMVFRVWETQEETRRIRTHSTHVWPSTHTHTTHIWTYIHSYYTGMSKYTQLQNSDGVVSTHKLHTWPNAHSSKACVMKRTCILHTFD